MNMKKMKKFFTFARRNGGFTLVELIVVIAILAILGGVAVPAYGGYVKKANMQADISLVSEVKQALELYYYANPNADMSTAWVILEQDGTVVAEYGEAADKAMTAVFGADWKNAVGLKYADWNGVSSTATYKESSYYGQESGLIQTVDKLTGALGEVIEKDKTMGNNLIGGQFETFLKDQNVDTDNGKAVGNAAVLYVADKTKNNETAIKDAFSAGLSATANTPGDVVNNLYANLYRVDGLGDAAAIAAIYAYAEGYAQSTGQADAFHANTDFSNVTNASTALEALGKSFDTLDPSGFATYVQDQGSKDLQGYIDMMGTVNDNEGIVSGNLNSDDCFTDGTVENLLKDHARMSELNITTEPGQIAVYLSVGQNGAVRSTTSAYELNQ